MQTKLQELYEFVSGCRLHAFAIYFTVTTILLISIGGIFSSATIGILTLLGLLTLQYDPTARETLLHSKSLLPIVLLLGCVLLWQSLGLILREPRDAGAAPVLGSALAIAMLLPVLLAAVQRDAGFRDRLLTVLFVVGSIAAVVSIARYFVILEGSRHLTLKGILHSRLVPIGRASHEILGSGGLAACFFAGVAIFPKASGRHKRLIPIGLALIILTIAMTQSRGPMIGMSLAVIATCIVTLLRGPRVKTAAALILALLCFLVPVGMITSEPWIKSFACTAQLSMCRPSNRQDVWTTVLGMIQERPWFGIGPSFRFPGGVVSHPHNGLLGLVFYFGLPMGILYLGIIAFAVTRTAKALPGAGRTFALLGIFFSMSFVATDLSNPFAFVNTLYLYLWLPVFMGVILASREHGLPGTARPLNAPASSGANDPC